MTSTPDRAGEERLSQRGGEASVGDAGDYVQRLAGALRRSLETGSGGLAALVVLLVFFSIVSPNFFTLNNIFNVADQVVVLGLLVIGQTFVIITRNLDISMGSIVAICAMVMADLAKNYGLSPYAVILAGVLVGLSCGLMNGLLVAKLKLNPLVSTLATWSVIKGAAFVYSNGQPIYPLPDSFRWPAVVDIGGLQANVLYLLVFVVVAQLILSNTKFGRHVFAVGGNPGAAELTGIRHDRVVMSVYMISGLMSALAAVILAGKLSAGSPRFGDPYLLTAVAAAVLGGASLFGGQGSIPKALFGGALVITLIGNGMNLLLVPIGWQKMVLGGVLAVAVFIDSLQHRKR